MNDQKQIRKMSVRDTLMSIICNDEIVDYLIKNNLIVSENAVVILDEDMEEFAEKLAKSTQMQKVMASLIKAWQKEMAEKIMNEISGDILIVNIKEYGNIEVVPLDRISEICENIIKGDKQ